MEKSFRCFSSVNVRHSLYYSHIVCCIISLFARLNHFFPNFVMVFTFGNHYICLGGFSSDLSIAAERLVSIFLSFRCLFSFTIISCIEKRNPLIHLHSLRHFAIAAHFILSHVNCGLFTFWLLCVLKAECWNIFRLYCDTAYRYSHSGIISTMFHMPFSESIYFSRVRGIPWPRNQNNTMFKE